MSYEKLFDKFLSFIVKVVFKMQVGKDTIFYGTINIGFVTTFTIVTIDFYPMNDGLFATVLTSRVIGKLLSLLVFFAIFIFVTYYHFYI